jgi:hypothetical protein
MATLSVWPALGTTVTLDDLTVITSAGASVTYTAEIRGLISSASLLTYDPTGGGVDPDPATGLSTIYVTTLASLATVRGAANGQAAFVGGVTGGMFVWDASSTDTADSVTIIGSGTGRWERVCDGRAVSVLWFGADPSGVSSSTTAIQNAINTGLDVEFPPGTYLCSGLTQSTNFQRFFSVGGVARLTKNASGVIFASTGSYVKLENIEFRGESASPSYTGHNATFSGAEPTLRHCGSLFAYARAILATGEHVTIDGTCSIYQTTDATGSGYDIEIGASGTATLYHVITGIRSTQSTGGIKLVETGAASISDSQFGKCTFDKGAAGAGSGGGRVIGNRITGAVTTDQSSGTWVGNQFGSSAHVTFAASTSGNLFLGNSLAAGCTVTNSGNANNLILKEVSSGGTQQLRIGDDTSLAVITSDIASGSFNFPQYLQCENVYGVRIKDTGGAYTGSLVMSAGNNLSVSNTFATGYLQLYGTLGVQCTQFIIRTATVSVTASTTQTQAAGVAMALTQDFINVSTCANVNDAIALPSAAVGREVTVTNSGAQVLQIFPFTSDDLGAGVNTSVTLAAGACAKWWAIDSTTWKRIV